MNMAGFGQGIKLIGLHHMQDLANQEAARLRFDQEMDALNTKAKGKAIGSLIGTGLGVAKGAYDDYKQGEVDADSARGDQARKEYGVLTDRSQPMEQRVRSVYGNDAADVIKGETQPTDESLGVLRSKSKNSNAESLHREMADMAAIEPRISQTGNLLGGKDTKLVINDPLRDYFAARQYLDPFITRGD